MPGAVEAEAGKRSPEQDNITKSVGIEVFGPLPPMPTYRLHDHQGDDLGAPRADGREVLVTARVESQPGCARRY